MHQKIETILMLLIIVILFNPLLYINTVSADSRDDFPYHHDDTVIINALNFLNSKQSDDGSIGGFAVSAWVAMAICAADKDIHDWGNLVSYLRDKTYLLDQNKATDWERHTLAITACNENPKNFSGIDFVAKIESFYDGTQIGNPSNLYDDFFGILALISAGVNKNKNIIQNTKSYIIKKQNSNGGWGDADSTAAAIMALISAGLSGNSKIITDALSFLKTLQTDDGGFKSWGNTNTASTSWVIMAISASGGKPTSSFWEKNGNNPVDYLLSLQQSNGSFNYTIDQSMNPEWITSYAIPALLGKSYPVKIYESSENKPPNTPNKPLGPTSGVTGMIYTYSTSSTDPDGDKVQYKFDWGDGTYSEWTSLVNSGQSASKSHSWNKAGTYMVKAQAKDAYGETSGWSSSIIVTIDKNNEWSGFIRIEGKNETIWNGIITVSDTYFYAKNVDTNETQQYYIPYPSVLGALIKASDIAGFSYFIEYWPIWDAFFVKTIDGESDWWHYWVDYELPMVGADDYELTNLDKQILWGYLETWYPHALKIFVDKSEVKKNEKFTISVIDETNNNVEGATVHVGSETYKTDENENIIIISLKNSGTYTIYAEKEGFVRSKKTSINVKKNVMITKPISKSFYFMNLKLSNNFKKTWIIGPIYIQVETAGNIEKVDFYINDALVFSDNEPPFEYRLNEKAFLKKNEIMVKAYSIGYPIN